MNFHEGENGSVSRAGSAAAPPGALRRLVADPPRCRRWRELSRAIAGDYDLAVTADEIVRAVLTVARRRRRPA